MYLFLGSVSKDSSGWCDMGDRACDAFIVFCRNESLL